MKNIFLAIIVLICASCSQAQQKPHELQLPEIPADLRQPQQRADFLVIHFWDNLDLADDSIIADEPFMEQSFSDFASVLPIASPDSATVAINRLLAKASVKADAYKAVNKIAETYLYQPVSPVYNEELFIPFLRNMVESPLLTETDKARPEFLLKEAMKNRVGHTASDFEFLTLKGEKMHLTDVQSPSEILLIFFDPDCLHCKETMATIPYSADFYSKIKSGELKVVAVYSGDEKGLWEAYGSTLPDTWIVGYEPGAIYDEELYALREFPTIYLLDKDFTVKAKNLQVE